MTVHDTEPIIPVLAESTPPPPSATFNVRSFGLTAPGKVRASNEDQFAILELVRTLRVHGTSMSQPRTQFGSHRGHLFLVADGMGGHQAGEVASAISVITLEGFLLNTLKRFFHLQSPEEHNVLKEFQQALREADARIFDEAARHPEMIGMGTTLTMAYAVDWRLLIAHAGDSRCYLLSQGRLRQLTGDHTVVAELVRMGELAPDEAARHPARHMITNALGGSRPGVDAEMHKIQLEPQDVVLVCSDGLTEMVSNDRIAAILTEEQDPQRACERLVTEANENGGKDNITAVVACFE